MTKELKIRLTPLDSALLDTMAKSLGISRAGVVRMALRKLRISMERNGWPLDIESKSTSDTSDNRNQKR
jgi:hypothetical protein